MKLVLLAIADRAHDNGYSYPTIQEISFKAERSERQVIRVIKDLEKNVMDVHRARLQQNLLRNSYTLHIHRSFTLTKKGDMVSPNIPNSMTPCHALPDTVTSPDPSVITTTDNNQLLFNPKVDQNGMTTVMPGWKPSSEMLLFILSTTSIHDDFIEEQTMCFSFENAHQRRRQGQLDNWFRTWVIKAWEKSKCEAVGIDEEFWPNKHTIEMLTQYHLIELAFVESYVVEFRVYWLGSGRTKTSWQSVFYQQCVEHYDRTGGKIL